MGEVDFYGIFLSPLFVCGVIAFLVGILLRRVLLHFRVHRLVWHPALFDLSLFVILLGAVVALSSIWAPL
jgi:protein AaeX